MSVMILMKKSDLFRVASVQAQSQASSKISSLSVIAMGYAECKSINNLTICHLIALLSSSE